MPTPSTPRIPTSSTSRQSRHCFFFFAAGATANASRSQIPAELVARWIAQTVAHEPKVVRPYDYTNIVTGLVSVIAGAVLLKFTFPIIKPALYSRNLWAAISLIAILLFTSGHMFNHIRRVPYVANNGKGGVSYIAGGFSNQFGLETQIIAVICELYSSGCG